MRAGLGIVVALVLAALVPLAASAQTAPAGIDVSHWQNEIDWLGVSTAGYAFAYEKATEGTTFTDITYPINRTGANGVGMRVGAYHMARPEGATDAAIAASAIAQAEAFAAFAQPHAGDLPPALDLEHTGGLSPAQLTAWTQAWLDDVTAHIGARPVVYASPNFWKNALGDTPVFASAGTPLWIAHWTKATLPILPGGGWGGLGWTFWQWTDCGHVTGILHCVDGDRFNGTSLASVAIPAFASGTPVPDTAPSVVGSPQTGKLLAALPGGWHGGKPVSFTYQWRSCTAAGTGCVPIPDAVAETYTPTAADAGTTLVVAVTAQAGGGSATATSAPTLAVAGSSTPTASAPSPVSLPSIDGAAEAGQSLTAQTGTWKGSPTAYAYQWRRCDPAGGNCSAIAGASAAVYTAGAADIGSTLTVVVTASGKGGSRSATAVVTPVVAGAAVPSPSAASAAAIPGQPGAVVSSDQAVTVSWQPGAIAAAATVSVGTTPSRIAVAGTAFALGVTASLPLPGPLDIQYAAAAPDAIAGFIPTSGPWEPVAPLPDASLPDGQDFGAYRDAAGLLHILTRIPGRFALFAPGAWGDPRFISTHKPQITLVEDFTASRSPDGSTLLRGRLTLDTQAHLYVSVQTPRGQALIPQVGSRVGWWLQGLPAKTLQTLQLRPGTFPIRLRIPAAQLSAAGAYSLRIAAIDPYGRTVQVVLPLSLGPRQ